MSIVNGSRPVWPVFLDLSGYTRVFPWLSTTRPVLCTGKRMGRGLLKQPQIVMSAGPLLRCCGLANIHHLPRNSRKAGLSSVVSVESEFINVFCLAGGFVTRHPTQTACGCRLEGWLVLVKWRRICI